MVESDHNQPVKCNEQRSLGDNNPAFRTYNPE